jgi:hypothetical protein
VKFLKKNTVISLLVMSMFSNVTQAEMVDFDLGVAGKYTFAVGQYNFHGTPVGGSLLIGSAAKIYGNVAASSSIGFGTGSTVFGNACSSVGSTVDVRGDAFQCNDIVKSPGSFDQLSTDIEKANVAAAYFYDPLNTNSITGSLELDASLGLYSAQSIHLLSGDVLTIRGATNDFFIINIAGQANIGSGAKILLDGVRSHNVIFNFLDTPGVSNFQFGGSEISGTFLANNRSFQMGDGATLENTRFYNNNSMQANVQDVRNPDYADVSTPALSILLSFCFLLLVRANNHLRMCPVKRSKIAVPPY